MSVYWTVWCIYVLICGIGVTMGFVGRWAALHEDAYYRYPSGLSVTGRFLRLLPVGVFGQVFAPGPLLGLIIGGVLTLVL